MLRHVKLEHSFASDRQSSVQSWVHSQFPRYIRRVCGILRLCEGESASWRCCWALNKSETCLRFFFQYPSPIVLPLAGSLLVGALNGILPRKLELAGVSVCEEWG